MENPKVARYDVVTPAPLRTPSDLPDAARKSVAKMLNELVADAFALYVKTKNFHWHISGPNFRDYHLLLDEQADDIFASIDPLAERVRKLGETTLRSAGQIAQMTRIANNDSQFVPPYDMLVELLEDNKAMARAMRDAHIECEDLEDAATAGLLETFIDATEKRCWFLFETANAASRTGH